LRPALEGIPAGLEGAVGIPCVGARIRVWT
jgi:hypothetical protein